MTRYRSTHAIVERAYARLLMLYPKPFRRAYGPTMTEVFRTQWEKQTRLWGPWVCIPLIGRAVVDVLKSAPRQRIKQMHSAMLRSSQPANDKRGFSMGTLMNDVRYAARALGRSPGFSVVAVLTLALGIGANTAVFSVLDAVVLSPLRYEESDRLVRVFYATRGYHTAPAFVEFRDNLTSMESMAAQYDYRRWGQTLTGRGRPQRINVLPVTADFFEVYRAEPILGRTFRRDEETVMARSVVLSHRLWMLLSDGDPGMLGRTLTLDGRTWEVVGVMPESFQDIVRGDVDLWVPQELRPGTWDAPVTSTMWNHGGNQYLTVIGRLAEGVSLAQAQAEIDVLSGDLSERYQRGGSRIVPLYDDVVGTAGTLLYVLMGAAGLVLLVACVNVANLFLSRCLARQREFAIRSALGSGRTRLIRQLLTESFLVALVGGAVGIVSAHWGVKALLAMSPDSLPRSQEVGFDGTLLAFAFGVTLLTGVLFGLTPALRFTRPSLDEWLRESARGSSGGTSVGRVRDVLVTSQVALALVLVVGAGLLMRSFLELQKVDLGMAPKHVTMLQIHLPEARYGDPDSRVAFHRLFQDRMMAVAGIQAAGAISAPPVSGRVNTWGVRLTPDGEWENADFRIIEGKYFEALNVDLLAGRLFEPADDAGSPGVAIINESAARKYFPDRDPLGQMLYQGGAWRVVGVVRDVAHDSRGSVFRKVYLPHAQFVDRNWSLTYVISTATERDDVLDIVRREQAAIDPDLVLHNVRTINDLMGSAIATEEFAFLLMAIFAGVAASLAAIGIYGVLAFSVNQQTREIGIRMALGADAGSVRRSVIRRGAILASAGIATGLLAAFGLSRLLGSMLFGVSVTDPVTFLFVPVTLTLVAAIAGYIPARRATRVDPMEALRHE